MGMFEDGHNGNRTYDSQIEYKFFRNNGRFL